MDVRKEVFLTPVHCKQTSYVQPTECQLKPKRSRHFMSSLNNAMMDATNRKREASKEKKRYQCQETLGIWPTSN